jgi:hypothetical protein
LAFGGPSTPVNVVSKKTLLPSGFDSCPKAGEAQSAETDIIVNIIGKIIGNIPKTKRKRE